MSSVRIADWFRDLTRVKSLRTGDYLLLDAGHPLLRKILMKDVLAQLDKRYVKKGVTSTPAAEFWAKAKLEVKPIGIGAKNVDGKTYRRLNEAKRIYNLGGGEYATIYGAEWLHVKPHPGIDYFGSGDSHYLIDKAGVTHYIPYGWLTVSFGKDDFY